LWPRINLCRRCAQDDRVKDVSYICSSWLRLRVSKASLLFHKPVAAVGVVVDSVLLLQFLDMPERGLGVRADTVVGMEQHLFQATVHAHALVLGQVQQESSKTLFQTHGDVHALDFDGRADIEKMMSEGKIVAMQVAHDIVTESVLSVGNGFGDLHALGAMELVKLIGVAYMEVDDAAFGIGRAFAQKHLRLAQVYAGEGRGIAPGEGSHETQLLRVELDCRGYIVDSQAGVELFAFDDGRWHGHDVLLIQFVSIVNSIGSRRGMVCAVVRSGNGNEK